jgi:peptidoglycan/xylan/chitin deacetylase (PgdA/CDA1 family)
MKIKEKKRFFNFLFHEIVDDVSESGFQRKSAEPYKHQKKVFYETIEEIISNSTNISNLNILNDSKISVMITFDDGGKSAMEIADFLDTKNIKGHFFITTAYIGNKFFLKEAQIKELYERGHIIGSHSHTHPNVFKSLTFDQMVYEFSKSKEILEGIINDEVSSCSVPGGDCSSMVYEAVNKCNYKYIFNSIPTTIIKFHKNLIIFGRISIKNNFLPKKIKNIFNLKLIKWFFFKKKLKDLIKSLIYPLYKYIHNNNHHEKNYKK